MFRQIRKDLAGSEDANAEFLSLFPKAEELNPPFPSSIISLEIEEQDITYEIENDKVTFPASSAPEYPTIIENEFGITDVSSGDVVIGDLEVLEEDLDSDYEPT